MDNPRIIHAPMNGRRYAVTSPITQYDYGYLLPPEGVELPTIYEIDFSNDEKNGTSLTVYGNSNGAEVPEELIRTGKDVYAFYYKIGEGYGKTEFTWRLPNHCRPSRDGEIPTPTQQSSIDQAISALNDAVEQTAEDVASADQSAQSASQSAESADQSAQTSRGWAESAEDYAQSAEQSELQASASAQSASQSAQSAEQSAQTASEKADAITGLTATAQTLPSGSSASASYNPQTGVMSFGIPKGKDGIDGYSPTANVTKSGKVATITITDKTGTTSAQVEDGTDGTDGVSPTVTITPITGGHRITITDADGEHSADVMDGTGNVDDVQINGQSIVSDGVANVPVVDGANYGVVRTTASFGVQSLNGYLQVAKADSNLTKAGTNSNKPIVPYNQHESTFYGLAKSAGDTTQSQSSNAVGQYTDTAKGKIQTMLGIADLIGNSEGATASKAYSVGDVLLHDGKLYKVTASIAQGSAIVPDTNCTQTTIIDLLRGA